MEGLGSFLLFALFFFLMMRYGCGSHAGHGGRGRGGETKHIDPVCGMEVESEKGYGKMYQGTLYRFCSKTCLDKFDADAERYIQHKREQ